MEPGPPILPLGGGPEVNRKIPFLMLLVVSSALAWAAQPLVVYSGRSKSLVEPAIERFQQATGLRVRVKYGKTAPLALLLLEEGDRSPADLFLAQDAGALSLLAEAGRFAPLPEALLERVPARFRDPDGRWIGVTGRARTLAYAPERAAAGELPGSVFDLTAPRFQGRVGIAPTNASFQTFVTAMRAVHGDARTLAWLRDLKANGARAYAKNTALLEGIAAGEIDFALPNHYYLLRIRATRPEFPVAQAFFAPGDVGNLVNVSGAAVLVHSRRKAEALRFLAFLLEEETQRYFAREVFEYPLVTGVAPPAGLPSLEELLRLAPNVSLGQLSDLKGTIRLLREAGWF